jgi:sec-independent protein translocase protein TatB
MMMPPTIEVASLGFENSLILMVLALVVFGPRRLPGIGKQIGKLMYEVRKASNDFKFQMEEELRSVEDAERRKKEEERLRAVMPVEVSAEDGGDDSQENNGTDSQVSDSRPGPPDGSGAPCSVESPYPNEGYYPATTAAEDSWAKAAKLGDSEEAAYPQIQLPTTGEPVPAARPGKRTAQVKKPVAAKNATPKVKSKEKPVKAASPAKKPIKKTGDKNA